MAADGAGDKAAPGVFSQKSIWLVGLLLLSLAALIWIGRLPVPEAPDRLVLTPARFTDLTDWRGDDHGAALAAFQRSCVRLNRLPAARPLASGVAGTAADWQPLCAVAVEIDAQGARDFFEANFTPFAVGNNDQVQGLFTGYYEIEVRGARAPGGAYTVPLYRRPKDLVSVDLGLFRDDYKGRRIAGRVEGHRLLPYARRGDIQKGALAGRGLELVWLDDAVDAFFLHVQGSGRVALADGGEMRVGYGGANGQAYTSIGRYMADQGFIEGEQLSMQGMAPTRTRRGRSWRGTAPTFFSASLRVTAPWALAARCSRRSAAWPWTAATCLSARPCGSRPETYVASWWPRIPAAPSRARSGVMCTGAPVRRPGKSPGA